MDSAWIAHYISRLSLTDNSLGKDPGKEEASAEGSGRAEGNTGQGIIGHFVIVCDIF